MTRPQIAIVSGDVFSAMGLKHLLEEFIPFSDIDFFTDIENILSPECQNKYFHYFISADIWKAHTQELSTLKKHIIIYGKSALRPSLPADIHFVASDKSPEEVSMALMRLQDTGHHQFQHYPDNISRQLVLEDQQQTATLTNREIEIIKMIASGKSSKEIACKLHISPTTVYTHRQHIMEKLHAHSAIKVVNYALNHGYIAPEELNNPIK